MSQPIGEFAQVRQPNLAEVFQPGMEDYFYTFMDALSHYINPDELTYGGSMAARYHARRAGLVLPDQDMRGVTVLVRNRESVLPRIAKALSIAHHHIGEDGVDFYMQVADAYTGLYADIFKEQIGDRDQVKVPFGVFEVPLITAADQLADTVLALQQLDRGNNVDPRLLEDAKLLISFVTQDDAETAWHHLLGAPAGKVTLFAAYTHALMIADGRPELLIANPPRNPEGDCDKCAYVPGYPLTPMERIQEILGYVE